MLALALALALAGQDAPAKCLECKTEGRKPCPEHPRDECALELDVLYCSEFQDCEVCAGVAWVDCPRCERPEVESWIAERRTKLAARRRVLQFMDDAMKRPLRKAEGDHMVLVWDMQDFKIEKRWVEPHEGLHVYLARLEQLFVDYRIALEVPEKSFSEKSQVFVWWLPEDHEKAGAAFTEQSARGGVKLMGSRPRYTVCGSKRNFQGDEQLHRNLVHSVTHLLLSNQHPAAWIGNLKAGWADEGLAHWFEDKYWGLCTNYCYQEQNSNVDFKGGKYRVAVRKMVAEGTVPPVAEVMQQNVDTLTLPMHAACFSYVDYLLSRSGAKFSELVKKLKAKVPSGDALQEVFGMRPLEFEAAWKAWVLATYPTR